MTRPFLGHDLTGIQRRWLNILIGAVHAPIGVSKRSIKSEFEFWEPLERIYGFKPRKGLGFASNVGSALEMVQLVDVGERRNRTVIAGYDSKILKFPKPKKAPIKVPPSEVEKKHFYASWEWRTLRMEMLIEHGARCQCCGAGRGDKTSGGSGVRIVVDHIKPLSRFWELRLDRANLQVLCQECNQGKGAWDETDWRESNAILSTPIQSETA